MLMEFFHKYVPGCKNATLKTVGSTLGIRESRHILGDYVLQVDDLLNGVVTDDAVKARLPEAVTALTAEMLGKSEPWHYEDAALLEKVRSYNKAYAEENDIEYVDADTEAVYSMITDTITSEMQVRAQVYVAKAVPLMAKAKHIFTHWKLVMLTHRVLFANVLKAVALTFRVAQKAYGLTLQ